MAWLHILFVNLILAIWFGLVWPMETPIKNKINLTIRWKWVFTIYLFRYSKKSNTKKKRIIFENGISFFLLVNPIFHNELLWDVLNCIRRWIRWGSCCQKHLKASKMWSLIYSQIFDTFCHLRLFLIFFLLLRIWQICTLGSYIVF